MSNSIKIKDQKIPYPTEGIVRTSSVDDTVAPDGSVQSAVNVNFDQIGAIKTRLGLTEYAPTLPQEIKNFGTLSNSYITDGYENIVETGAESVFGNLEVENVVVTKINDTKVVVFWNGVDNDGFAQNFLIDEDTGVMTPLGTPLEFDIDRASSISVVKMADGFDSVIAAWTGSNNDGFVQSFFVWEDNVTARNSPLEFDTSGASDITLAKISDTHAICFYEDNSSNGIATVFNLSASGAITEPGSSLTFDSTGNNEFNSCVAIGDGTRFMNSWSNSSGGRSQVFSVNTSTWAITALSSPLVYDTGAFAGRYANLIATGDGEHFVNISTLSAPSSGYWAQAYNVNLTSYAVTKVGTAVRFADAGNDLKAVGMGDGEHFAVFYSRNLSQGFANLLRMNPTNYNMSVVGDTLDDYDFGRTGYLGAAAMSPFKVAVFWGSDTPSEIGKYAMFSTVGNIVGGNSLYAGHGTDVSNWDGSSWVVRRSGLAEVSKPRFTQYLSYIWMVNGNKSLGGNPVQTSRGGAFGTELVPDNFPAGDFIQGGFEGRVWVADSLNDVIYFTDIVQFTPPNTYTLTYDPKVNFIKNFSPQDGQTITGFITTPRALLLFKQNSIYRIYGSFNVDAYPAYNVGTYSEESIVQTKKGLFFHHSSGFYKFNYGGEPVEISRTINDFVQAIPRAYYKKVAGVFDGSDAILWSVGPLTVEGVSYSNAVMRYTISTQVWTVYNYEGNNIRALVKYDDGTNLNIIMGTNEGKINKMDSGFNDLGELISFEMIDRWRSYSPMYADEEKMVGFNVYNENAAGTLLQYQNKKQNSNKWSTIGSVTEKSNSLFSGFDTEIDNVSRLRLAGTTKGDPIVIHGIEVLRVDIEGYNLN